MQAVAVSENPTEKCVDIPISSHPSSAHTMNAIDRDCHSTAIVTIDLGTYKSPACRHKPAAGLVT
jgi:hypothetical protein